ncbi:MAG: C10 family peptidase, partial [Muribaculaceae bacterium]|nr:C10 family peptidase [Muribaculaceae bacterium]
MNSTTNYGSLLELRYLDNLTKGIPVIARGEDGSGGHEWILDGYTNNISGRHYHINWGWGP